MTTSLLTALETSSTVIGRCYRHKQAVEFHKFFDVVDNTVRSALGIRLMPDNSPSRPPGGKVVRLTGCLLPSF